MGLQRAGYNHANSTWTVIFYLFIVFLKFIMPCGVGFTQWSASLVAQTVTNVGDLGLIPGFGRSPGKGNVNPLQYSCLESSMNRGPWWATDHRVTKSWAWLSDLTHTHTHTHALEKEMATHFSVLAWRNPGTGKPGMLQSMGLQSVRHTT